MTEEGATGRERLGVGNGEGEMRRGGRQQGGGSGEEDNGDNGEGATERGEMRRGGNGEGGERGGTSTWNAWVE